MTNEEEMKDYNMRADALCERVQDQIKEGDTLDIVMEMVTFMAATTGLQIIDNSDIDKAQFIEHFAGVLFEAMDDLSKQDTDKLTRSNYVQ